MFIMEGLWSRFFPAWQYARQVVASGELGKLISIDAATCWGAPRPEGFPRTTAASTRIWPAARCSTPDLRPLPPRPSRSAA